MLGRIAPQLRSPVERQLLRAQADAVREAAEATLRVTLDRNDVAAAFADAEALGLGAVVRQSAGDHEIRSVASPIGLSATPPGYHRPPPALGADTDEVLEWLEGPEDGVLGS